MNNRTYSELALRTAPDNPRESSTAKLEISPEQKQLLLAQIGLSGETGEIAEMVKKHVFHGHEIDRERLIKEAGDVLWYLNYLLVRCCQSSIADAMAGNIRKLAARYPEGFFTTERSVNRQEDDV